MHNYNIQESKPFNSLVKTITDKKEKFDINFLCYQLYLGLQLWDVNPSMAS